MAGKNESSSETREESNVVSKAPDLPEYDYPPMPVREELSYLPPPMPDLPPHFYEQEGVKEKMIRKSKDNPFVPIGCIATAFVLTKGLNSMRTGQDRKIQQFWMRARVAAQGFAIISLAAGMVYQGKKRQWAAAKESASEET